MNCFIGLFMFILGILIGSFLNVCIYRIPRGESIVFPPSHCTNCRKDIKYCDLIPILSYIFLKGKCRDCGEKIPIHYIVVEALTGVLFLLVYLKYGTHLYTVKYITFISLLIVIACIDLYTTYIYTSTIITADIFAIIFLICEGNPSVMNYICGGAIGGGVISLIIIITKSMGWGDAEICFFSGLFLGIKFTIVMLFLSFLFGSIISLILMLLKKKSRKDYIPFGPFIAIASIFTVFLGNKILFLYFTL
ncbi:prepilin peptidase [Clostridium sp. P21]|uniref:Prepilin peptidase n=1 Tax=Clostridium muellerianum TaxID=2716538 RepID=A0A7Y0EL49_9CLOT|nr:A24 family peptidase [Clostridium muellerianum]NMM65450.1 prepilin peptidase [Clostridium muellerianum]